MGIYMDILLGSHAEINVAILSSVSIVWALINASIVYGLRRQEVWAIILGGIEMVILIIAAIANLVSVGLSDMMSSIYWLIIALFFLFALRREYNEIKNQRESHV
jgi:hypothetical protein